VNLTGFLDPGTMPVAIVLAIAGGVWGVAADRIATRWPEHDEVEGFIAGRRLGWRTVVVAAFGAIGLGLLPSVFIASPAAVAQLGEPDGVRQHTHELLLLVALLAGSVLSIALEAAQSLLPARIPSKLDVLSNAAGTLAGAMLAVPLTRQVTMPRSTSTVKKDHMFVPERLFQLSPSHVSMPGSPARGHWPARRATPARRLRAGNPAVLRPAPLRTGLARPATDVRRGSS
jgi:hypothetical protein